MTTTTEAQTGPIAKQQTWLIVGASRGIGLEYATQLLALGHRVLATARATTSEARSRASRLYALTGTANGHNLNIIECDVTDEKSIEGMKQVVAKMVAVGRVKSIDVVVLNAGVLVYPNRISEISFNQFNHHLQTNTIGPLLCASALLSLSNPKASKTPLPISTIVFTSSDSGSTTNFRAFEDGFAAYAASKAALNQGLRHLAAEQARLFTSFGTPDRTPTILAIHPGEVTTDMADIQVDWEVEGIISPPESVSKMLKVIAVKGSGGSDNTEEMRGVATFWTWEGQEYPW